MDILVAVKAIQKVRGINDTQMSVLLGYKNRAGWARIKGGIVPAGRVFEARALRAFPELYIALAESSQDGKSGGVLSVLKDIYLKARKFL